MPTLDWLSKPQDLAVAEHTPYRLLQEVVDLGYGDKNAGNIVAQGDNLALLKSLLPFYAGQVKCIYIDPPYNTGSAFEHYDDNLEHTKWLSMIYPRLELLRQFLREDGSIWISIDDDEQAYLKVICDEIFGRKNFVSSAVWEKKYAPQGNAQWLSDSHDYILLYARNKELWRPNLLPRTEEMNARYKNPDNDPRGVWKAADATISLSGGQRGAQYAKTGISANIYELTTPSGKKLMPAKGRCWYYTSDKMREAIAEDRIWFGENGDKIPAVKRFLHEVKQGITAKTIWFRSEAGDNQEAKQEAIKMNADSVFSTPKPERLIQRILTLSTNSNDLVLDSFLGSGTTAAVAHKMGRKYIGIEIGDHAITHCVPRLRKVIDGEQGGISKSVGWSGGGGFRFFTLGAEAFDGEGRINEGISFENLAAHIWFSETKTPFNKQSDYSPFLGVYKSTAFALLYNGVLGDKRANGGNILTNTTLKIIRSAIGLTSHERILIYGEGTRLGARRLKTENIVFKQTPYDIKAR
jgi:adenine-specific DNA-methyltransferase